MCGRATLTVPAEDVARIFEVDPIDIGPPRFNLAPTQPILTVRAVRAASQNPAASQSPGSACVRRELALMRWGLIPWWAKPDEAKRIASRCIQARAESVARAPAFRDAFQRHRCLVVVDGFFEWKTLPDGRRVPHVVRVARPADGAHRAAPGEPGNAIELARSSPFAIAAVWDTWRPPSPEGVPTEAERPERIESCAVLTTRSGGVVREIHDRMPLILGPDEWDAWLGGGIEDARRVLEQSQDAVERRASNLVATPVSTWVNDVRHDDPTCIEPLALEPGVATAEGAQGAFQFAASPAAPRTRSRRRRA